MASLDNCTARIFSVIIRVYSAGVQAPDIIRVVRCHMVSHEAAVSSAIISGSVNGEYGVWGKLVSGDGAGARPDPSMRNQALASWASAHS